MRTHTHAHEHTYIHICRKPSYVPHRVWMCSSFSLPLPLVFSRVRAVCIDPRVYTRQKEEITRSPPIDDAAAIEERKLRKRLMVNYDPTTDVRGSGLASFNPPPPLPPSCSIYE